MLTSKSSPIFYGLHTNFHGTLSRFMINSSPDVRSREDFFGIHIESLQTHDYSDISDDDDMEASHDPRKFKTWILRTAMKESESLVMSTEVIIALQTGSIKQARLAVISWLFKVSDRLQYRKETLYNAIFLFDQILTKRTIQRSDIELTAIMCLWISSKTEEMRTTDLSICCAICQEKFTKEQFITKELEIVQLLGNRVGYPTSQTFIRAILADLEESDHEDICGFFLDVSLCIFSFLEVPSAIVAAAAVYTGLKAAGAHVMPNLITEIVGIDDESHLDTLTRSLIGAAVKMIKGGFGVPVKDADTMLATIEKAFCFA